MKNISISISISIAVSIFLMGCGSIKIPTDAAAITPVSTFIDLTKTQDDKVPVVINPGRFLQDTVTYYLPKVVQGTYSVSNFGRFIDDFKAIDYKGAVLKTIKLDDNTWQIINAKQLDKITYMVNDTYDIEYIEKDIPFSPSGTNIEPTNYVLNLHGFIGYFDILKKNQYTLQIKSPATFKSTAALQRIQTENTEDGSVIIDSYVAPRYFDITDNPMMYGDLDIEEFQVGDIKIVLSVYSPNKVYTAAEIKETVFKMMKAQKTFLGAIDSTLRYDIYLYLAPSEDTAPKGFGALEHHTSTVVVLPEAIPKDALSEAMIDVVSHEFFHIVTPLSVHSEDVHYFDYNDPTFSKHLWMYEGVTEYFASIFQVHEGLVSEEEFYTKIMGKIQNSKNYDDTMSFTEMSEHIIEQPYEKNYANVYEKGALIGMCIDILIKEESDGKRRILDLMKELSLKYGKNKPFDDDKIIDEIITMTYPSVGSFLKTNVIGTTPIDYSVFFEKVGLVIKNEKVKTTYIQNNGELIIAGDPTMDALFFTDSVTDNSFWAENGVQPMDVIKEINGVEVTLENANTILNNSLLWQEGDMLEAKLDRVGKEIIIKTKLKTSYTKGMILTDMQNATKEQVLLRNAWLKG